MMAKTDANPKKAAKNMPVKKDAGLNRCRPEKMLAKKDAGQKRCQSKQILAKKEVG